ncbi:GHKL domain-containing protein [Lachnospiraceae bacterium ZAX-1]
MTAEWIIVETLAVFVESLAKVYFLNSQLPKKSGFRGFFALLSSVLISWGLVGTFAGVNQIVYDVTDIVITAVFVYLLTDASIERKIFNVFLVVAIPFAATMVGAGMVNLVFDTTFSHTLYNQDTSRLLSILFIKAIELMTFVLISKKQLFGGSTGRTPAIVLMVNSVLCIIIEFLLWALLRAGSKAEADRLLVAMSVCALPILIAGFVMYDIFARLERQKSELSNRLQRSDMEMTFREEVKNMHTDLQKWRHEYKNHLIAIGGYIASGEQSEALRYLEKVAGAQLIAKPLITTNNQALDAVINSKLWLAKTRGIDVSAQSAFPESGGIKRMTDGDLCSIIGNLLDNSIESCDRMAETDKKFLTLELLVKGNNLFLMIYNSYIGEIKRDGELFISSKGSPYNGIGLKYVDSIIGRYGGYASREYNNGVFSTQVMIPLLEPNGGTYRAKNHRLLYRLLDKGRARFER